MNESTIDRKFQFVAVNPVNGHTYTEEDAFVICAKDKAAIPALRAYVKACWEIGANQDHLRSIDLLINRVKKFQETTECRVPDTIGEEVDRCVHGKDINNF